MKMNPEETRLGLCPSINIAMTVMAIALLASCDSEAAKERLPRKTSPASADAEIGEQPAATSPVSLNWLVNLHEKLLSTDPEILSKASDVFNDNKSEIESFAASHYEKLVKDSADPYVHQGSDQENNYRYNMLNLLALSDGMKSKQVFVNILKNPMRDLTATSMSLSYAARKDDESIKEIARNLCETTGDPIILEYCRDNGF